MRETILNNDSILAQIVRRLVEAYQPERIYYPGEEEKPTREEAEETLAMAYEVHRVILDRLPQEIRALLTATD